MEKLGINIFMYVQEFWGKNFWWFFLSFLWLLFLTSIFPFIATLKNKLKQRLVVFGKTFLLFTGYLFVLSVILLGIYFLFWVFSGWNVWIEKNLSFWEVAFNSLRLVIFYYVILALAEELSKFFCFKYASYFTLSTIKEWVLFSLFVALGFAFFENIMYLYNLFNAQWFGQSFVWLYISRNIFSVVLHVLCSSIFAYFFTFAYLKIHEYQSFDFIKKLFLWFFLAVVLHAGFNIFITLDIMSVIMIYLIGAYFYLTYIFYENQDI